MRQYNVILGITGGIAAYKAAILVSSLVKKGISVEVIMTENATNFITPLTFETLTKNRVIIDMFKRPEQIKVEHIELAKRADKILIAPATYNIIGKIASGIADDMLSTVIAASESKNVIFAPAMNKGMYLNPIYTRNCKLLKELNYEFIEPEIGNLACNDIGIGRLRNPDDIVEIVESKLKSNNKLQGEKILITAGPTEESIDPIRLLTNRSTGKMGYALARAARDFGADVLLISGNTNLKVPLGIDFIQVESAKDMEEEVLKIYDQIDIVIMSAAVADYRPKKIENDKIKKNGDKLLLDLERTTDILRELGKDKRDKFLIGFSAETQDLIENSLKKLENKNLDMIIGNGVTAFGDDKNEVQIIDRFSHIKIDKSSKDEIAVKILEQIYEKYHKSLKNAQL